METKARRRGSGATPVYGDYPELFWDADPGAPLDVAEPTTSSRLLTRGSPEVIGRLASRELIAAELEGLPVPDNVKYFWRLVPARSSTESDGVGS